MNYGSQDCPKCDYPLKVEKNFNLKKDIKRADIHYCPICNWSGVKNILEDTVEDLPPNEFVKEKLWVNKTATKLLPSQRIKIRFVKSLARGKLATTRIWLPTNEPTDVLFTREVLQNKKHFKKVATPHELGHASKNVYLNPNYNPFSQEFAIKCSRCGQPHPGEGHDKVWHDEFDRLKEEIEE